MARYNIVSFNVKSIYADHLNQFIQESEWRSKQTRASVVGSLYPSISISS